MAEEQKREKSRKIYSTKIIDQLVKDRSEGYDIDWEPFFFKDLDLRDSGITFRMTDEELEEYQKCYDDPEYYIAKYCKFQTDDGWSTVELRDFQKNVVDTVTAEVYDPENDKVYPKNRNVIWMASRQSGKCLTINKLDIITSSNNSSNTNPNVTETDVAEMYYEGKHGKKLLDRLIYRLTKIYNRL